MALIEDSADINLENQEQEVYFNFINSLKSPVTFPKPQIEFGFHLAKYFSSSIDFSDGLSSSLYELAQKSNKVDMLVNKIPTPKELCHFANLNSITIINTFFLMLI